MAFGRGKNPVQEYPGLKGITGTFLVVFLFNSLPSLASCFDVLTHRHLPSKGGFKNFTPPPPAERHKFAETFLNNSIFEFRGSPHAEALFNIKGHALQEVMEEFDFETLTLAELPELIEDLFYSFWKGKDSTVLLYTIYLISRKGKNFEKVSDYAVEFLKVFWHIILPSKSREQINGFIREYGVFCFEVLYRVGLIDIDRELDNVKAMKSDYKMKASDFFNEWIRFVSSH